jgi:hypothetical protein
MNPSLHASTHDLDTLTLPRPFRLVSNALILLCLLAVALAFPVLLSSAAQKPVAAEVCSTCIQPAQTASLP